MIGVSSVLTVVKYGFLSLVVTSAGYLIANITIMKHYGGENIDDLVYKPQIFLTSEGLISMLDKRFDKCLTRPTTTFCLMSANKRISLLRSKGLTDPSLKTEVTGNESNSSSPSEALHPIHSLLRHFSAVAREVGVKPVLLEPSMLFCMLSAANKLMLLMEEFNPARLQGARTVVTMGVTEEESKLLDKEDASTVALSSGFEVSRVRRWIRGASFDEEVQLKSDGFYTIHYFFNRGAFTIHLVVFFGRRGYVWHSSLRHEDWGLKDLLFVKTSAYENFTAVPLETEKELEIELHLPSDPVQFLFQIESSEYRNCSLSKQDSDERRLVSYDHPSLTDDQLRNRVIVAIQELKNILQPHIVRFWLWTKSLAGWYKDCDVFHGTSELHLAASHTDLQRVNFSAILPGNEYLKVVEYSFLGGEDMKIALDCHGLLINMFVSYGDGDSVWFYEDVDGSGRPQRVVHPKFRLCSTHIFGQRVNVPCDPHLIAKSVST